MRAENALVRLSRCAVSPEPSLLAYVIRTQISINVTNTYLYVIGKFKHTPKRGQGNSSVIRLDCTTLVMYLCDKLLSSAANVSAAVDTNTSTEVPHTIQIPYKDGSAGNNSYISLIGPLNELANSVHNYTLKSVEDEETVGFFRANIRLLKAVVLGCVVIILILSTCKFVLKIFSRYTDDTYRRDEEDLSFYI